MNHLASGGVLSLLILLAACPAPHPVARGTAGSLNGQGGSGAPRDERDSAATLGAPAMGDASLPGETNQPADVSATFDASSLADGSARGEAAPTGDAGTRGDARPTSIADARPAIAIDAGPQPYVPPDARAVSVDFGGDGAPVTTGTTPALLIVGRLGAPSAGDLKVEERLRARGFAPVIVDGDAVGASAVNGKALVVVSASASGVALAGKLASIAAPILCMKAELFSDLGMTGATGNADFGSSGNQTALTVPQPQHPLAAGLAGYITVVNIGSHDINWGVPGAAAVKIAAVVTMPSQSAIFGYSANAMMVGRVAPARRVGFFAQESSLAVLNRDGAKLLEAAIDWTAAQSP